MEEIEKLKEMLEAKRKRFLEGTFLEDCPHLKEVDIASLKIFFQGVMEELDNLELRYTSLVEETKNELRERCRINPALAKKQSPLFNISVRRSYEYDLEALEKSALARGIDPQDFYIKSSKFSPKLVPDSLKEELKKYKRTKSVSVIIKDKK